MEVHRLIGKRKKKKQKCPNPLFERWLLEWKNDASSKGLKSQHTYSRALQTLRKYPVVLTSGKECKILQNFGDKICQMLDEKLASHVAVYGTTLPVDNDDSDGSLAPSPPKRKKPSSATASSSGTESATASATGRRRTVSGNRGYVPQYRSGPYAIVITLYKKRQVQGAGSFMTKKELMREAQPLADKSFTLPDPGSRYTAWSSMGSLISKGFVNKHSNPAKYTITESGCELAERMLAADAQMPPKANGLKEDNGGQMDFMIGQGNRLGTAPTLPSLPSDDSQATNVRNKKPTRKPNVPKHGISDSSDDDTSGHVALMDRIRGGAQTTSAAAAISRQRLSEVNKKEQGGNAFGANQSDLSTLSQGQRRKPASFDFSSDSSGDDLEPNTENNDVVSVELGNRLSALPAENQPNTEENWCENKGLQFWYIDEDDNQVMNKDRALVTVDETLGVGFLVRTDYEGLLLSGKKYSLDTTRSGVGDQVFAYLSNDDSPQWANVPKQPSSVSKAADKEPKQVSSTTANQHSMQGSNLISSQSSVSSEVSDGGIVSGSKYKVPTSCLTKPAAASSVLNSYSANIGSFDTPPPKPTASTITGRPPLAKQPSIVSATDRPVILSPMSIKSLTDDSQSQSSETGSQNAQAQPEIRMTPRSFDIVLLVDNAEIFGSGKGKEQLLQELQKNKVPLDVRKLQVGDFCWAARSKFNPEHELVLHHIVERKRMDDLASSIVDGRFKEQKFRLKNCGLKRPIYLVEEYGSMKHFSISEDALSQAIVNTQVIDEFFVKRTTDTKESAAYLTIMTRYLQSNYMTKTLMSYPKKQMDKLTADEAIGSGQAKLLKFEEFDRLSVKTRALTVQEMFGKQLVQIRGITPEKAAVIVDKFHTPALLMQAYANCISQKERENLLGTLKVGALQRNLGATISKAVCMLYTHQLLC